MTELEQALYTLLSADVTLAGLLPGGSHLVTVTATGGTFRLTFNGATTTAISEAATAATVQAALAALPTVGAGNVLVTGGAGGPWTVTFTGALADTALALTGSGASLTPPGSTLVITQRAAVYNTVAVKPPAAYLVMNEVASTPEYAIASRISEEYRYQFTVVTQGASRATIGAVKERLDALLDQQTLTVTDHTFWYCEKVGDDPSSAEEVGGALWQWGGADYRFGFGCS